ncbi:MAG TPA: dTDP-4-dehydrorhamnose 3,5-epimerase [Clostridiales bacterium]|nr:dTDP-4-dehydrorhamnose 3,5-epimerase [Clostridiales bacterium]
MSLNVSETGIEGLKIIQTKIFRDERGYFFEVFSSQRFSDAGINDRFFQDNISRSGKGVVRGLHYQLEPKAQSKLLTVISGKIIDAAVDLRTGSPTFGKHFTVELCSNDGKMIYIPKGFAHGFLSLTDDTVIMYKCGEQYSPAYERGIRFNDPELGIDWKYPAGKMTVSERDRQFPLFRDAEMNFKFGK